MVTEVLLGFLDEPIPPGCDISAFTSKIGGQAVLFEGSKLSLHCRSCRENSALVCQLYCPVDDSYHRTLYIYCCLNRSCHRTRQGWQVLRVQNHVTLSGSSKQVAAKAVSDINCGTQSSDDWGSAGADDWGSAGADDWGSEDCDIVPSRRVGEVVDPLPGGGGGASGDGGGAENTPCNSDSWLLEALPIDRLVSAVEGLQLAAVVAEAGDRLLDSYYISVVEDSGTSTSRLLKSEEQYLQELERDADRMENSSGGKNLKTAERYEKTTIAHGDKMFYKFSKDVSRNPSQLIRYAYNGTALPMSSLENLRLPLCENCGASRVFEVQLMPALVQSVSIRGKTVTLDIGTVIIFSCSKSCWSGKTLTEYPVVQHDPDEDLLNDKLSKHFDGRAL